MTKLVYYLLGYLEKESEDTLSNPFISKLHSESSLQDRLKDDKVLPPYTRDYIEITNTKYPFYNYINNKLHTSDKDKQSLSMISHELGHKEINTDLLVDLGLVANDKDKLKDTRTLAETLSLLQETGFKNFLNNSYKQLYNKYGPRPVTNNETIDSIEQRTKDSINRLYRNKEGLKMLNQWLQYLKDNK